VVWRGRFYADEWRRDVGTLHKKWMKKNRQKGSHVIVKKEGHVPETIPMHKELKKGLEKNLMKQLKDRK
jgi:predicted RNA binding protein YcfA (HicA-like mRNA interferase family)